MITPIVCVFYINLARAGIARRPRVHLDSPVEKPPETLQIILFFNVHKQDRHGSPWAPTFCVRAMACTEPLDAYFDQYQ